jgi:Rhodopirellula transposase DDE domain
MMIVLTEEVIASFKDAARKLTGPKRRAFQAQVTLDYLDGSVWKAERVFGWSHHTVTLGLNELRTGITCLGNFSARGNHKTEEKWPELEADIRALADPESQVDPKFQSPFLYTRMTAKAMRQALIDQKGWTDEELPHQNTIGEILNRLGYKLRRVQKTKPLKKVPQTDAIFDNVRQENQAADDSPEVVRISLDAKAKVDVGDFSRDGETRASEAPSALDHDTQTKKKLVPQGILNVTTGLLTIFMGTSHETSDFIVDCLEQWWAANQTQHPSARRLVINLDNGPENSSARTQFLYRLVKFSDDTGLEVKLVYYPPYHSKYNLIERCWGILENHWNGTLLNSIDTVVEWARTMTWKGAHPVVSLVAKTYDTGVRVAKAAFKAIESRLQRDKDLPKYDVLIQPQPI